MSLRGSARRKELWTSRCHPILPSKMCLPILLRSGELTRRDTLNSRPRTTRARRACETRGLRDSNTTAQNISPSVHVLEEVGEEAPSFLFFKLFQLHLNRCTSYVAKLSTNLFQESTAASCAKNDLRVKRAARVRWPRFDRRVEQI